MSIRKTERRGGQPHSLTGFKIIRRGRGPHSNPGQSRTARLQEVSVLRGHRRGARGARRARGREAELGLRAGGGAVVRPHRERFASDAARGPSRTLAPPLRAEGDLQARRRGAGGTRPRWRWTRHFPLLAQWLPAFPSSSLWPPVHVGGLGTGSVVRALSDPRPVTEALWDSPDRPFGSRLAPAPATSKPPGEGDAPLDNQARCSLADKRSPG